MLRSVSFSASGQEQGIDQYIPPDLRGMFYKNPAAIHASHNGLDPYGFMTRGLVLYYPAWALKGSPHKSVDAYKHTATVTGALWQPDGRLFDGADDRITIGNPAALQLTNTTVEILIKAKGYASVTGFCEYDVTQCRLMFDDSDPTFVKCRWKKADLSLVYYNLTGTMAAGFHQIAYSYDNTAEELIGYLDGVEGVKSTSVTAAAGFSTFLLGEASGFADFDNIIGETRVYNRILTEAELAHNKNCTIWRYQ